MLNIVKLCHSDKINIGLLTIFYSNRFTVASYRFSAVGVSLVFTSDTFPYSKNPRQPIQHYLLHHCWYRVTTWPSMVDIKNQNG